MNSKGMDHRIERAAYLFCAAGLIRRGGVLGLRPYEVSASDMVEYRCDTRPAWRERFTTTAMMPAVPKATTMLVRCSGRYGSLP